MTDRTDDKVCRPINRRMLLKRGVGAAALATTASAAAVFAPSIACAALKLEKEDLKFGFIKLTDMAPIAIAKELGYLRGRRSLRHARAAGQLEGAARPRHHRRARRRAHAGRPAARRHHRLRHQGACDHAVLDGPQRQRHHRLERRLGGDEAAHPEGPRRQAGASDQGRRAQDGGRQVSRPRASPSTWAWCSRSRRTITSCATGSPPAASIPASIRRPTSPARSWPTCCSSVTPPPQMPATLEAGTILGYCVGEPWNQQAVFKGIGVPVITDYEIWKNNPEKVFGITADFAEEESEHRARHHQGADPRRHVARRQQQRQPHEGGEDPGEVGIRRRRRRGHRQLDDRHVRVREGRQAPGARLQRVLPLLRDLSLLLGRGLVPHADAPLGPDPGSQARRLVRRRSPRRSIGPTSISKAAKLLVDEGKAKKDDFPWTATAIARPRRSSSTASAYDGRKPNAYIDSLKIGLKGSQRVEGAQGRVELNVDAVREPLLADRRVRTCCQESDR